MKKYLVLSLLILISISVFSQTVNVDTYTGRGTASVHLWTVTSGSLSFPITLYAPLDAIPVEAPTGQVGTGWAISANGSIIRELKSLPDDYLDDVATPKRYGWLRNSTSTMIGNFTPQADDNYSTITDEVSDYNFLNRLGGFSQSNTMYDTEPDLFHINVPGFGGTFVFDNNGQIRFLDQRKIKSTVLNDSITGEILGFILTDESGVTYTFGDPISFTIETKKEGSQIEDQLLFKSSYFLYQPRGTKKVQYNSNWRLTSIKNSTGDIITFTEAPVSGMTNLTKFELDLRQNEIDSAYIELNDGVKKLLFTIEKSWDQSPNLRSVVGDQTVEFFNNLYEVPSAYGASKYDFVQELLHTIKVRNTFGDTKEVVRQFTFNYRPATPQEYTTYITHLFLESIVESTMSGILPPTFFEYHGITKLSTGSYEVLRGDRSSKLKDEFGFHSNAVCCDEPYKVHIYPSLANSDRFRNSPKPNYTGNYTSIGSAPFDPSHSILTIGLLKQINTPTGGSYRIYYEPHDYYDNIDTRNYYASGLRVKRVEYHDGVSYTNDFDKSYLYQEDGNTNSSGVLLDKPARTFALPYKFESGTKTYYPTLISQGLNTTEAFRQMVVYSYLPLNNGSMPVAYKRVTESVTRKGKTVFEYNIPAGYGVTSLSDWSATKTKVARYYPPTAQNLTPIDLGGSVGGFYAYPFAPNPNYEFKMGLLTKVSVYDSASTLLTQTEYVYTNSSPLKTYGLVLDRYTAQVNYQIPPAGPTTNEFPMFLYSRYEINTGVQSLLSTVTRRSYDRNSSSLNVADLTTYQYATGQTQPFKVTITNSDGVEHSTSIKYPHDYSITAQWDQQDGHCKAITMMKAMNILNFPIEKMTLRKEPAGSELYTGASLSLFNYDATSGTIKPMKQLSFSPGSPSTFAPSSITNGSSSAFTYDQGNYTRFVDFINHTEKGQPQSQVDYAKQKSATLLTNRGLPIAVIANATAGEIVYTDFEQLLGAITTGTAVAGRIYGNGRLMGGGAANKFTFSLQKGLDPVNTFSCWVNTATSTTLTIRAKDGTQTVSSTIAVVNTNSKWKYYSTNLNINTLGNSLTLEVESSLPLSIDDVLFHPSEARVMITSYGPSDVALAQTSDTGLSSRYEYDTFNRLVYVRDQDENILKANTYNFRPQSVLYPVPALASVDYDEVIKNTPITFKNMGWGSDDPNATCKWRSVLRDSYLANPATVSDFTNTPTTTGNTIELTFSTSNSYVVNLQVTSQGVTKEALVPLTIQAVTAPVQNALSVSLCSNKGHNIDICTAPNMPDCPANPPTSTMALKATVSNGSGNYTYEWFILNHPTAPIPAGSASTFVWPDYLTGNYTYRCKVTDTTTGATTQADYWTRIFYSNPTCVPLTEQ